MFQKATEWPASATSAPISAVGTGRAGNVAVNRVPLVPSYSMVPFMASQSWRTINRPSPLPPRAWDAAPWT